MIEQCNLVNAFWNSIFLDATKTDNGMGNC